MSKCDKLLRKASASKKSFRFSDLCRLVECWGYELRPQRKPGSHIRIYKHKDLKLPATEAMLNLQPNKRKQDLARPYQIDQVLDAIDLIRFRFPNYEP